MMDRELEDLLLPLRKYAKELNRHSRPAPDASAFYEIMSGGLVWSDEKIPGVPTEVVWALRPVWAYRSSLIAGTPSAKWQAYWETCLSLFPDWIGFLPERRQTSSALVKMLREGEDDLARELAALEK